MSYLGIDVGSVSIKFVLLSGNQILDKVYLRNRGIISTIKTGLSQLRHDSINGVGITGSGKEFVRTMVRGDITESEIICHLESCTRMYPDVRTILDVGGEDSKLILVKDRKIKDFQMNRDCGGGTGAMIESIASRLGIPIEDVGKIALQSINPCNLPGKCGIFCQSAVVSELSKGRLVADILMGVCRALVGNFLTVLAKGRKLEPPIVFQGATARNIALVKCFSVALGHEILVPENCDVMGAIGSAHLVREKARATIFKGIEPILESDYMTKTADCDGCENRCELLSIYQDSKMIGRLGSRCGKNNVTPS